MIALIIFLIFVYIIQLIWWYINLVGTGYYNEYEFESKIEALYWLIPILPLITALGKRISKAWNRLDIDVRDRD